MFARQESFFERVWLIVIDIHLVFFQLGSFVSFKSKAENKTQTGIHLTLENFSVENLRTKTRTKAL